MTREHLMERLREVCAEQLPLPGVGATPERLRRLVEIGCEDLTLAKLAEAHWDAVSILAEAGLRPEPGAVYAVWASEAPGKELALQSADEHYLLNGTKPFCSGAELVDEALVTVSQPERRLVAVDLRVAGNTVAFDFSGWHTEAFRLTQTGTAAFRDTVVSADRLIGAPLWYLERPGFWHGACGPAACWVGGVEGLLHYARDSRRDDGHTAAHRAAMEANLWACKACLDAAGREMDAAPQDRDAAQIRALSLRHTVEQLCTDTLTRFVRAYGPHPLAADAETSRRYAECTLYMRQTHGERDLEALGRALRAANAAPSA